MWDILTDVVLQEWFGVRLPPSILPWEGSFYLPPRSRLLYCLDRTYARQANTKITKHYLPLDRGPESMSIFAGYGLAIPDDIELERNGLSFIARQVEHLRSLDDCVFIMQDV